MGIFLFIGLEAAASIAVLVCWIKYDARIRAWEDRQLLKLQKAARRQLLRFCDYLDGLERRSNRIGRKLRREICAWLLAKDRLTVQPMNATSATVEQSYTEVIRLLKE